MARICYTGTHLPWDVRKPAATLQRAWQANSFLWLPSRKGTDFGHRKLVIDKGRYDALISKQPRTLRRQFPVRRVREWNVRRVSETLRVH